MEPNVAELSKGLAGIQKALKNSKSAAHGSAGGSSTGIIGSLEVCESDFSKELAEIAEAEDKQTAMRSSRRQGCWTWAEAEADVTEKAFCDMGLSETNAKKDDKSDEIEKLTAKSKILRGEVTTLQAELGELTKSKAETDKVCQEEKSLSFGQMRAMCHPRAAMPRERLLCGLHD